MPVGVTFGSFGDILSLCLIIKNLVKALDDSTGASAEYQEVIRELWGLERVLFEVEMLWRTCETTIELNAFRETARCITNQWRCSIETFLEKGKKYGPSLRDGGSGNVIRDMTMKIRWQGAQPDELTKFRGEIQAHCSTISALLGTANLTLTKLNGKRLDARLAENDVAVKAASEEQQRLLGQVKDKLKENNKQIRAGNAVATKVWEALRLDWCRQLGQELKTFFMNVAIYNALIDIRGRLPSHLERGLYLEPFILEDGIGRILPVHTQFVCSWEAFDFALEQKFRNVQGYKMVLNKKYVIQETSTRKDIDRSFPWEASFLPGQKLVMSMLFNEVYGSTNSCPRCQTSSEEPQISDIQCASCGMWYRRITEYNDADPPPPVNGRERFPSKSGEFGSQSSDKPDNFLGDHVQDDITRFKRVRVLLTRERIRKAKPAPEPYMSNSMADISKCSACQTRKMKCLPYDRDWNNNQQRCKGCENWDLPCGPSFRSIDDPPRTWQFEEGKMLEGSALIKTNDVIKLGDIVWTVSDFGISHIKYQPLEARSR